MIFIWGTKGRIKTIGQGTFNCPNCRAPRQYEHRRAQRWFTLYFIPVFPMSTLGESVTCNACNNSYVPAVLEYDPARHHAAQKDRVIALWRAAMVTIACAFGPANPAQAEAVNAALPPELGSSLDVGEILEDCRTAPPGGISIDDIVGRTAGLAPYLSCEARENFLVAALSVMRAGSGNKNQREEIALRLGEMFALSPMHIRGILASAE
ncbi:MAG: zinc ribbon domain-containing protein [Alphaproteobacteria bacterium]|nr:zinc ribbon domain-containing protein [Alphaproteobacteria bacterium]